MENCCYTARFYRMYAFRESEMATEVVSNVDAKTVEGFGQEWSRYDQTSIPKEVLQAIFDDYFAIFPLERLTQESTGADFGCGSGRWAKLIAPKVSKLYCVDASEKALAVARRQLEGLASAAWICAPLDEALPIPEGSLDFAYSLGVLHHIPDTVRAMRACVKTLKPGAPFLVYLYYAFDNKPIWFRGLWRMSHYLRLLISRLPFKLKVVITEIIAALVYYPLSRCAAFLEKKGRDISHFPLAYYRKQPFYIMRTDALDRFGTRLEQRFTQQEVKQLMKATGLERIHIHPGVPYWCAIGYKSS